MEFSWIQKHALLVLVRRKSARVRDLMPPDIAANLFSYHLDRLVAKKLIEKTDRGTYTLTTTGHKLAGRFSTATNAQTDEIKTVIMLYAKRDNMHMLFRWSRQPYIGEVTPLYDRVSFGKTLHDGIASALSDKLETELPVTYKTSALVKIVKDNEIISHMNAYIYEIDSVTLQLPCETRNGIAFFARLDEAPLMHGVKDFLEKIDHANEPFEAVWRY